MRIERRKTLGTSPVIQYLSSSVEIRGSNHCIPKEKKESRNMNLPVLLFNPFRIL